MRSDHDALQPGASAQGMPPTATANYDRSSPKLDLSFIHKQDSHIARRQREGPVKVADMMPRQNPLVRINSRLALLITIGVDSMWCAYVFTGDREVPMC